MNEGREFDFAQSPYALGFDSPRRRHACAMLPSRGLSSEVLLCLPPPPRAREKASAIMQTLCDQ